MASSLFQNNAGGILDKVESLKRLVGGNPDAFMEQMMRTNPKFAEFVNANRNKTPEQIASEYGLDINPIRKFM